MSKLCLYVGCKNKIFGGGFCKFHQWVRKNKKLKAIKKVSEKGKKNNEKRKTLSQKDAEFFQECWDNMIHRDFETGEEILGEPLKIYFHHCLEKKLYPQYRYKDWNIVLVSLETHSKCHTNIDFAPRIKAYREQLLKTWT